MLKDISKLTALPNREHENKNMTTQTMGTLNNILQSTLPQKEMPAEIKKSRALDIADGLLMISNIQYQIKLKALMSKLCHCERNEVERGNLGYYLAKVNMAWDCHVG